MRRLFYLSPLAQHPLAQKLTFGKFQGKIKGSCPRGETDIMHGFGPCVVGSNPTEGIQVFARIAQPGRAVAS